MWLAAGCLDWDHGDKMTRRVAVLPLASCWVPGLGSWWQEGSCITCGLLLGALAGFMVTRRVAVLPVACCWVLGWVHAGWVWSPEHAVYICCSLRRNPGLHASTGPFLHAAACQHTPYCCITHNTHSLTTHSGSLTNCKLGILF